MSIYQIRRFVIIVLGYIPLLCFCIGTSSKADFVIYSLPGTKLITIFEGKTKLLGGKNFEYLHPTYGAMILSLEDARIIKAPSRLDDFKKLRANASKSKSADDFLEAARESLRQGLLKEFYECCGEAYK